MELRSIILIRLVMVIFLASDVQNHTFERYDLNGLLLTTGKYINNALEVDSREIRKDYFGHYQPSSQTEVYFYREPQNSLSPPKHIQPYRFTDMRPQRLKLENSNKNVVQQNISQQDYQATRMDGAYETGMETITIKPLLIKPTGNSNQDLQKMSYRYGDTHKAGSEYDDLQTVTNRYSVTHTAAHMYGDTQKAHRRYGDTHTTAHLYGDTYKADHRYSDMHKLDLRYGDTHKVDLKYGDTHKVDLRYDDKPKADNKYNNIHTVDLRYGDTHKMDLRYGDTHKVDLRYGDTHKADHRYDNIQKTGNRYGFTQKAGYSYGATQIDPSSSRQIFTYRKLPISHRNYEANNHKKNFLLKPSNTNYAPVRIDYKDNLRSPKGIRKKMSHHPKIIRPSIIENIINPTTRKLFFTYKYDFADKVKWTTEMAELDEESEETTITSKSTTEKLHFTYNYTFAEKRPWTTELPDPIINIKDTKAPFKNTLRFTYRYTFADQRKWTTERSNPFYYMEPAHLPDPDQQPTTKRIDKAESHGAQDYTYVFLQGDVKSQNSY